MSSAGEQTENRLDLSLSKRNVNDKVQNDRRQDINGEQTEINIEKKKNRSLSQTDESLKLKSHIIPIEMTPDKLKCTTCITWQNIYQIFEFLTSGILITNNELEVKARSDSKKESIDSTSDTETSQNQNTLSEMAFIDTTYKLEYLSSIVNKLKLPIKNPADPSDSSEWTWNYKSSQHYKLLKLKLNLISQTNQLIKTYNPVLKQHVANKRDNFDTKCKICFTQNKKLINIKMNVLSKLNDYVFDWKPHLERVFDRFKDTRMKSNYDINNLNDLNVFLRTPAPIKWFQLNMNNYTTTMKKIDKYSLKAYNLLDLLVGDNFFYNSYHNEGSNLKSSSLNRRNYSSGKSTLSNSFSSNSQINSEIISNYSTYSKHTNAPNYERFCSNLNNQSSRYANSQALDENQYSNYYSYKSSRGSNSTRSRQSNDYFRTNNHVYNEDSRNLYTSKFSYQNASQGYLSSSVYLNDKVERDISQLNRFIPSVGQNNSSFKNNPRGSENLNFQINKTRSSEDYYNKSSENYDEYSNSQNLTNEASEPNDSSIYSLNRSKSLTHSKNCQKVYDQKCDNINNSKLQNERSRSFSPTTSLSKSIQDKLNTDYQDSYEKTTDVNNNYLEPINQDINESLNELDSDKKMNETTSHNERKKLSGSRKHSELSRKLSQTINIIESLSPLSTSSKYSKVKNHEIIRKKKSKQKSNDNKPSSATRESKKRKLSSEVKISKHSSKRRSKRPRVDIELKKTRKSSSYKILMDKYQENKSYLSSITSDDSLNASPSCSSISSSSSFSSSLKSISSEKSLCSISSDSYSELSIQEQKALKKNLSDISLTSQSSCSISSIENLIDSSSTKHYNKRKLSRSEKEYKLYKKDPSEQKTRSKQITDEAASFENKNASIISSSLMTEIKKNKDNKDNKLFVSQSYESEKKLKKKFKNESNLLLKQERNRPKQTKLIILSVPESSIKESPKITKKFDPLNVILTENEDIGTPLIVIVDFELPASFYDINFSNKCPLCKHQIIKNLEEMSEILPIISHKLSNLNLKDYINDFNKKFELIKEYEQVIRKVLLLSGKSQSKYNMYARLEDNITNPEKVDFECKLKLMQRIINECLERLIIQNSYLNQLRDFLDNLNETCNENEGQKDKINTWMLDIRKSLYISQANLIEYARSSRNDQCLIKNLSFYCLIDILNRFSLIYNIRSIDFSSS